MSGGTTDKTYYFLIQVNCLKSILAVPVILTLNICFGFCITVLHAQQSRRRVPTSTMACANWVSLEMENGTCPVNAKWVKHPVIVRLDEQRRLYDVDLISGEDIQKESTRNDNFVVILIFHSVILLS